MNKLTQEVFNKLYQLYYPSKAGSKNKYQIQHYLENIGYVLKTGIAWRDLRAPLHWSTYYKKFNEWTKRGLFKLLHQSLLVLAQQKKLLSKEDLKTLFIDSTMIKNVKGIDLLGKNHYDRNRKGNKLTLIISSNGIPLAINLTTANRHDQLEVIPAVQKIQIKILSTRLVADKGYVSKALKEKLKKQKIRLIYPYKKNQKNRNTKLEKQLLSKRYLVENTFALIQNYRRLRIRYDKQSTTFIQFYYLGLSEIIAFKIIN